MKEIIKHKEEIIAIIIRGNYEKKGVEFITPKNYSLQIGYMAHPTGYEVIPHTHYPIRRETIGTQEVLFIKSGIIRIDFYSSDQIYLESRDLQSGDIILLATAGHGISVLEEATIVEVKNGPFTDGADKLQFQGRTIS